MNNLYKKIDNINVADVIGHYVPNVSVTKNMSCPFHEDKTPSFKIYTNTNSYFCFSCQKGGGPLEFVEDFTGLDKKGAIQELEAITNVQLVYRETNPELEKYLKVMNILLSISTIGIRTVEQSKIEYFKKRGFSDKTIYNYKLGYFPLKLNNITYEELLIRDAKVTSEQLREYGIINDQGLIWQGMYSIPIKNEYGEILSFVGRAHNPDAKSKYILGKTNKFFKMTDHLFNFNNVRNKKHIFVVEGVMDALSLIQSGINNVVALMGLNFARSHKEFLKDKHVCLLLDNDVSGKKGIVQTIKKNLDRTFKSYNYDNFPYKDFNEALLDKFNIKKFIKGNVVSDVDFMLKYAKDTIDISTKRGKKNFSRELYPLWASKDSIDKKYIVEKVGKILEIEDFEFTSKQKGFIVYDAKDLTHNEPITEKQMSFIHSLLEDTSKEKATAIIEILLL